MSTQRLHLIRSLTQANGAPGFETNVRKLYQTYLGEVSETIVRDNFGGVVGVKIGDAAGPKVLIAGHLDEIGLMVTYITDEGFIKFQTLGGWWSQVMLAQRMVIQTRNGEVLGITGSKPPHILTPEERTKAIQVKDIFIDIGVSSKEEAEAAGIRPGDAIVPYGPFEQLTNPKFFVSKALDNRLGAAAAVELLRSLQGISHPNTVYAGSTAQEEVGLRGAQTLVHTVKPDVAIALDVGIAGDTPGLSKADALSKCGEGPILLIYDTSMIPNPRLRDFVLDTAASAGLKVQVEYVAGGGTDAGRFHLFGNGVPSVAIGFPTRYIHSHTSIYHQDDFDGAVELVTEMVKHLDATTLQSILD